MRPLDKGPSPVNSDGNPISHRDYQQWRSALIDRIGYYCVYCNMPLSHSLQVEHVIPINPLAGFTPGDLIAWENMLLSCGPCNNAKNNTTVTVNQYYLPEEHNTHLPFQIIETHDAGNIHAIVSVRPDLTDAQQQKAKRTIELFKLDNIDERGKVVDIRSQKRRDAMAAINANLEQYIAGKTALNFDANVAAQRVAIQAKVIGFFSLWYDAFINEPEVMYQLVGSGIIKGTAQNCFDPAIGYQPINRNPGYFDPI